jgi:hypothetical protein
VVYWRPRSDSVPVSISIVIRVLHRIHAHTFLRILYVPELNHRVFQVDGLTWHWGLVFGQLVLYLFSLSCTNLQRGSISRENRSRATTWRLDMTSLYYSDTCEKSRIFVISGE